MDNTPSHLGYQILSSDPMNDTNFLRSLLDKADDLLQLNGVPNNNNIVQLPSGSSNAITLNQVKKCFHHSSLLNSLNNNNIVNTSNSGVGGAQHARYMRVGPSNAIKSDTNIGKMVLNRFGQFVQPTSNNNNSVNSSNSNVSDTSNNNNNNHNQNSNDDHNIMDTSSTTMSKGYGGLLAKRFLILDLYDGNSVHKCFDVKTREEYVCKSVNNPCSSLLTAHFRLDGHQHINPLRKVIQATKLTYLLFSPSQGDLHSYVRIRKRLKESEARKLFKQMCETVKACHEQGIVLRDLKLRKFIFADVEKTQLRLESLEDAVVLDNPDQDLLQDKRGCPAYVSPEILKVNATYSGKAADMWSLGVILYTMLVGRYPFNDSEHASLFAKISRGHFLVPDCLTSTARCIIRSLLRRDPEERITSDDILFHPWLLKDDHSDTSRSSSDQCVPELYMQEDEE